MKCATHATQVAKVSPSGCYCASGDVSGVVKIWAIDNPERWDRVEGL